MNNCSWMTFVNWILVRQTALHKCSVLIYNCKNCHIASFVDIFAHAFDQFYRIDIDVCFGCL